MRQGKMGAFIFVLMSMLVLYSQNAFSARVKIISEEGILELDNGENIVLAGIEIPPESFILLSSLLGPYEIEVEYDLNATKGESTGSSPKHAYIYVHVQELDLVKDAMLKPYSNYVMINELLLELGAARVMQFPQFKRHQRFEELENHARMTGKGIWSYDLAFNKSSSE